jgi:hypothetical protein
VPSLDCFFVCLVERRLQFLGDHTVSIIADVRL